MTCFRCGRPGHYSDEFNYDARVCFEYREEGCFMKDYPKKKQSENQNVPPKPRTFQMTVDAIEDGTVQA